MAELVEQLIDRLQHAEISKRIEAAQQLAQLGTDAAAAALPLIASLDSSDESLREWSNATLEECGAPHLNDLPRLMQLIQPTTGASHSVVYWALTLIGRLERHAESTSPILSRFIEDASHGLSEDAGHETGRANLARAIWALGCVGYDDPAAKQFLMRLRASHPILEPQIQRALQRFA